MSPPGRRVCYRCKREFDSGRAFGGHMKTHYKDGRKTNFTRKKGKSKRKKQNNNDTTHEIVDVSKSLSGSGWNVRKSRSVMPHANRRIIYANNNDNDDDDYYLFGDADEDRDEDGLTVMERLRSYGFRDNAHQISMTRREYVCNTCDVHLPTFHAVLVHVDEHHSSSGSFGLNEVDQQGEDGEVDGPYANENAQGDVAGEEDAVAVGGVKEEDEKVVGEAASTQVPNDEDAADAGESIGMNKNPPKIHDFDLNELPPAED